MTRSSIPDIDKTIAQIRKRIDEKKRYIENRCVTQEFYDDIDYYEQLAGWLEELKELREKNDTEYIKGYNQGTIDMTDEIQKAREYGYNKAIDDLLAFSDRLEENHNINDDWHKGFRACISKYRMKAEQLKGGADDGK